MGCLLSKAKILRGRECCGVFIKMSPCEAAQVMSLGAERDEDTSEEDNIY